MELNKHSKSCISFILTAITVSIVLTSLHYALGVAQWVMYLSLAMIFLCFVLFFFMNMSEALYSYFSNKWAHRLFIFYYLFGCLFTVNNMLQFGDSFLKNILLAFTPATIIALTQNTKKIKLKKKHTY